jgi:hypothetical protein
MGLLIHREAKLKKCLSLLRKSGGAGYSAARRAEEIIQSLAAKGEVSPEDHKLTKHGELRIDKCVKFDLGCGYRLIGVKKEGQLILSFAGNHDDCDRWIENNRKFDPVVNDEPSSTHEEKKDEIFFDHGLESEVDYDDLLMKRVDEKVLRYVFRGLCEP